MANEKRLINVKPLMENGWHLVKTGKSNEFQGSMSLADVPTVDAVEVMHGRWLRDSESGKYYCTACEECALSFKKDTLYGGELHEVCLTDYCPNCGAKMDLED